MKNSKFLFPVITACFLCLLLGIWIGRYQKSTYIISTGGTAADNTQFSSEQGTPQTGKININTAPVEDLVLLPGIGPSLAQRIVEYRTEHGRFSSITDICNVNGIGEAKFSMIQSYISVGDSYENSGDR